MFSSLERWSWGALWLLILVPFMTTHAQNLLPASTTVRAVAWNPDGIWIARAFQNGTVNIVNINTGATVFTFNNGQSPATALAWRPGAGSTKLAAAIGNNIYLWDVPNTTSFYVLDSPGGTVDSLDWTTQNGDKLASASFDADSPNLRVWDTTNGQLTFGVGIDQLGIASWNSNGTQLVIGGGLTIETVDPITSQIQMLSSNSFELSAVRSVAWSPDGTKIADSGVFGQVTFRNASNGQFIAYSEPSRSLVNWISWSNDSTRLASASWDGTVRIWKAANGALLSTIQPNNGRVFSVDWSPDNSQIVVGSENGAVQIFPAPSATPYPCPCSLWSNSATPAVLDYVETVPLELGVKFKSIVNGFVTGIRFYKGAANTGTHTGHLWTSTGTLLATATFTNETASGWQTVNLSTPVAITANTIYVVSYYSPSRHFSYTFNNYFSSPWVNGPLTAPAHTPTDPNGVFGLGSNGTFPNLNSNNVNYWVDVVITQ